MTHLISGEDFLARNPGFQLKGRDSELKKLSSILMRQESNSVLIVGPTGVGATALCMGLQALKKQPDAPFDIVSKNLFWLDTDSLFSSGDSEEISTSFQRIIDQMNRTMDSVLIIEDVRDFIEAARNSNNTHFINLLTLAVKNKKTQVILEVRDPDLEMVFKWHSDIRESYTLMDLQEPRGEFLLEIVQVIAEDLTEHHGIRIAADAVQSAIDLTTKYRNEDIGLAPAQPKRAISLLDRALASYRLDAHKSPRRAAVIEGLIGKASNTDERQTLLAEKNSVLATWDGNQKEIKRLYTRLKDGQQTRIDLEEKLAQQLRIEDERRSKGEQADMPRSTRRVFGGGSGFDSEDVSAIKSRLAELQSEIGKNKADYDRITAEINADLELDRGCVLAEFSRVSGMSVNKLGEDDISVLRRLEHDLRNRVFGQDHVLTQVANGIKVAKVGRRNRNKPLASYMFIGPSGVGKTEVAKVVALSLLGDEKALFRFDMSEYMEKHGVAKLIGAPPGYEGFEAGGILTNGMRRNPNRVILFDEIEKAHPDVFNVLLQVLDDGRLTDNVGRTVDFSNAIIIMTSNIGQPFFLNVDIPFDEAKVLANKELEQTYRSEFLNRFNGRQNIICFDRLGLDSIEKIVRREVADIDAAYAQNGIDAVLDDVDLQAFCRDHYDPKMGARGLPGYIQTNLESIIVNRILEFPDSKGVFHIGYARDRRELKIDFREAA